MSLPGGYRAKAADYAELARMSNSSDNKRDFQKLERSFSVLADNEQWLAANQGRTLHAPQPDHPSERALAAQEERILRCLGAALMMRWNTLPQKLQREIFDDAGAMGGLLETGALRGQIARFVHKHNDGKSLGRVDAGIGSVEAPSIMHSRQDAIEYAEAIARWDTEGGAPRSPSLIVERPAW
jgi:hypothetical protein